MKTQIDAELFRNIASAHGSFCLVLKQLSEAAVSLGRAAEALRQIENYGAYMSQSICAALDCLEAVDTNKPTQE